MADVTSASGPHVEASPLPPHGHDVILENLDDIDESEKNAYSSLKFLLDGTEIELFWHSTDNSLSEPAPPAALAPQTPATSTPLKPPQSKAVSTLARVNRPFKSPLANSSSTPNNLVPAKRSLLPQSNSNNNTSRRSSFGLPSKRRKSNLPSDPESIELERRKEELVAELKEAKDRLRQLQLLAKENNSPKVLEALTLKWKRATQEAAIAYQTKCIESGAFANGQADAKDRGSFFGKDVFDDKKKASEKPGFMGWPGWTGYGWAKDGEDEENEEANTEIPSSTVEQSQTSPAVSPTSIKSLLAKFGYNVQQLKDLLDYVEEDDSFRL